MRIKRSTLVNALYVAAEQYRRDSQSHGTPETLHRGFLDQAREATQLAGQIEQADVILLED